MYFQAPAVVLALFGLAYLTVDGHMKPSPAPRSLPSSRRLNKYFFYNYFSKHSNVLRHYSQFVSGMFFLFPFSFIRIFNFWWCFKKKSSSLSTTCQNSNVFGIIFYRVILIHYWIVLTFEASAIHVYPLAYLQTHSKMAPSELNASVCFP